MTHLSGYGCRDYVYSLLQAVGGETQSLYHCELKTDLHKSIGSVWSKSCQTVRDLTSTVFLGYSQWNSHFSLMNASNLISAVRLNKANIRIISIFD